MEAPQGGNCEDYVTEVGLGDKALAYAVHYHIGLRRASKDFP